METQRRAIRSAFLSLFALREGNRGCLFLRFEIGLKLVAVSLYAKVAEFSKGKLKNFVRNFGL